MGSRSKKRLALFLSTPQPGSLILCLACSMHGTEVLRAVEANEAALREEVGRTREAIDDLHTKHRALLSEVSLLRDVRVKQQAEIRALSGASGLEALCFSGTGHVIP